uniref:Uncharacterized protein n=1 Tax=Timema bartmani TaxID=61472 RepID=A0A7R9EQH5_9NEOP|nr:unnamed protein product [Timema bartmani]
MRTKLKDEQWEKIAIEQNYSNATSSCAIPALYLPSASAAPALRPMCGGPYTTLREREAQVQFDKYLKGLEKKRDNEYADAVKKDAEEYEKERCEDLRKQYEKKLKHKGELLEHANNSGPCTCLFIDDYLISYSLLSKVHASEQNAVANIEHKLTRNMSAYVDETANANFVR